MKTWISLATLFAAITAHAAVTFAPPLKPSKQKADPDYYAYKRDQAYVDSAPFALSVADRRSISAATLKTYTQEQLDQLYFRLGSGPIPTGDFHGSILVKNQLVSMVEQKVIDTVMQQGLFDGFFRNMIIKGMCGSRDRLECLGEFLWKGKRFYPPNSEGTVQLRNAISTRLRDPLLLNSVGLMNLMVPLGQARVDNFDNEQRMMLFPANVYCGVSLVDTRRESIIIDYAYGDDFQPYIPEVDSLAGRNGKWVRDEIRMIRPGLYLGRAYVDRLFLLNFVLEQMNPPNPSWKDTCWGSNSWQ